MQMRGSLGVERKNRGAENRRRGRGGEEREKRKRRVCPSQLGCVLREE